jgi:protocatechuate 3,4-dioxygenase beta subunit
MMANAQRKAVWGVVTDSAGQPVAGAAVKLANKVTLTIRSVITQANGEYRFNGLHPDIEYTVRAQKDGIFTKPKTLSYFKSSESVRVDIQFEKRSEATSTRPRLHSSS